MEMDTQAMQFITVGLLSQAIFIVLAMSIPKLRALCLKTNTAKGVLANATLVVVCGVFSLAVVYILVRR